MQTYANNATITAICQNSTVCKECKSINTSLTPKIMKIYHTVENLSELTMKKFQHFITFLLFSGIFVTATNFMFWNSNSYTCKISMVKAILDIFIEMKYAKHYYIYHQLNTNKIKWHSKQNTYHVTKKNIAPSEITHGW